MIFGIASAVLLVFALSRFLLREKQGKAFRVFHITSAVIAIILCVVHLATTIPLFASRPLAVILSGFALIIVLVLAALSGAIQGKHWIKWHRILAVLTIVALISHIVCNTIALNNYREAVAHITVSEIDVSKIPDGEYLGECDVTYVYAKVKVSVQDGKIIQVEILEHRTERGQAAERIADDVVSEQRIDVDAVSSATNSSKVIKMAIYRALMQSEN